MEGKYFYKWGCLGLDHMVVGFITTYAISCYQHQRELESQSSEVYSIQHYVIKFVSDLQQVGGYLWVLWFPPPIKLTATIITEILLKVALNTITLTSKNHTVMKSYLFIFHIRKNFIIIMRDIESVTCCLSLRDQLENRFFYQPNRYGNIDTT